MISPSSPHLIVRLPNWVGDVMMALPALYALHESGIALHLIGPAWAKTLLSATPFNITALHQRFGSSVQLLKAQDISTALLLTNSFSSAWMMRLAGKEAVGYRTDLRRLLLQASLAKTPGQHEVIYFWEIAALAARHCFPSVRWPTSVPKKIRLPLPQEAMLRAQQALDAAQVAAPFMVLAPFAQGIGKNKQSKVWPAWRQLSGRLAPHYRLVVCPGKNEEALCAQQVPEAIALLGLNLAEYAAVLAKADCVIANDSGPMHLAAAMGKPVLGIFGQSMPERTYPWGGDYLGALGVWPTVEAVLSWIAKMT